LVLTKKSHGHLTMDSAFGVQKVHVHPTPRVGGIGIYLGLLVAWIVIPDKNVKDIMGVILLAGVPALACGLLEDVTKRVGVMPRLLATMASGLLAWMLTGIALNRVDVPGVDTLMALTPVAVIFTAFAIGGVANAINIVDGFHGLASGISMIALLALAEIAALVGDHTLVLACLLVAGSVAGFWLVNYPWGKLFMGDGGAYFVGFALAWLAVLLPMRNPQVSVWAALLVCAYPIIEVLYSVIRRYVTHQSPGAPDSAHLHSLIKTRFIRDKLAGRDKGLQNAAVSPIVWGFCALPAVVAVAVFDQTALLASASLGFLLLYHLAYRYLVQKGRRANAERESFQKPRAISPGIGGPAPWTISVLGTVGIPASYGGFETLVENLARAHRSEKLPSRLVVYCSAKNYVKRPRSHLGAELRYLGLSANGMSSVLYDIVSLFSAVRRGSDVLLLLGVSGAIALPLVRLVSKARIVTNIDGVEWKREKWKGLSKWFLQVSELAAVRFSHEVIADNAGIADHVHERYGRHCRVIAYGGDHAIHVMARPYEGEPLPARYALALCRIEPENNAAMILEAFARKPGMPLVFVGNWKNSSFGQALKQRYSQVPHLYLLDPIYDLGILRTIRGNASLYVHGHSAGGTNPSLVEIMHFGLPVMAYDCIFNRYATEGKALFFKDGNELRTGVESLTTVVVEAVGTEMMRIAQQRYTWETIARDYFEVLGEAESEPMSISSELHYWPLNPDSLPPEQDVVPPELVGAGRLCEVGEAHLSTRWDLRPVAALREESPALQRRNRVSESP
jgi:UDP-N-acetylmuramyl pentapeptide phosphotransferase/UDP-N-acetylglucosamine-1-phosphate transferase/glycosyltransferase involved in cell wall biosynthesis